MLGVRPNDPNNKDPKRRFDVDAVFDTDPVTPGSRQGLSVFCTPAECRIDPKAPVWGIESDELGGDLSIIPDPLPDVPNSTHCILEPSRVMTLGEYQATLWATRQSWTRIP